MRLTFELGERRSPYQPKVFESRASLENPSVSLADSAAWRAVFGEWKSRAGVAVNEDSAMGVPAIFCAVSFLAGTIAALPLKLYRKSVNGRETIETGRIAKMLAATVNENLLTSFAWRRDFMTQVLLRGRAPTFIERPASGGDAMNLWPLDMAFVEIKRVNGRIEFILRSGGGNAKQATYQADEILDIKFLGAMDGLGHFSPITALRDCIGLTIGLGHYASRFFQNGGVPPLVMEGPAASPAAVARAKDDIGEAVRQSTAGEENILYMPGGHTLKPVGIAPDKGQLIEARRFQVEEVSRVYNLPPAFLHNLERATFGNVEQQDLNLVKHCIVHWVEQIEQEANAKLFGVTAGRYLEFDLNGLLRGDIVARMAAYASAVQNGIMKPAEVRRRENLPDVEGADALFMQSTVQPITAADPASTANPEVTPVDDPA